MQYRKNKGGKEWSVLGYGCMRFSRKGTGIDLEKAQKEVAYAIEHGVNYLDTAYVYPGSEAAVGEILARTGLREQVIIATKLPHYLIKSIDGVERMFQEELNRLQTDYVDNYLMHMLDDCNTWKHLVELGIVQWIEEKKQKGQILNIGFSYHGHTEEFKKLIDIYDWDFCQIQYNYMDETSQAGVEGLRYAHSKGIPVVIMEGLRGGRLVDLLPDSAKRLIKDAPGNHTAAELAFKWLYNQPEVTTVLSGMNSMEMVEENLKTAELAVAGCLKQDEKVLIDAIKEEIAKTIKVGCTGCRYCMPCPQGVDIPLAFRCYNEIYSEGKKSARKEYLQCTTFRKDSSSASQCIGCGKCEKHCPQSIEIRKELKKAASELEGVSYRFTKRAIKTFKLWG